MLYCWDTPTLTINNTHKLLCLCYHGFLNSTTIYLFFLSVHLPFLKYFYFLLHFKGDFIMDNYLNSFREMISLRGLTDHTLKNYCTYIRAYLDYLSTCLHKLPEDVSCPELRDYIKWLQNSRNLSDRTINCAISQLRFLPCMSFTNRGMIPSFLCADLTNIFPLSLPNRKFPSLLIPCRIWSIRLWSHSCFPAFCSPGESCTFHYRLQKWLSWLQHFPVWRLRACGDPQ